MSICADDEPDLEATAADSEHDERRSDEREQGRRYRQRGARDPDGEDGAQLALRWKQEARR